jgi:hypothetical protein
MIGVDSFDSWPAASTGAGWWIQLYGTQGLDYWLNFAKEHGKQLSVPEWGNVRSGSAAGGDDPEYVRHMYEFFNSNAGEISFECNFQSASSSTGGGYGAGTFVPRAARAYKTTF